LHCGFDWNVGDGRQSDTVESILERDEKRREPMVDWGSEKEATMWRRFMPSPITTDPSSLKPFPRIDYRPSIPPIIASHPALFRLYSTSDATTPSSFILSSLLSSSSEVHSLWTDCFRPRQAAEVLGNEVEALYLRDWIQTLEVKRASLPHPTSTSSSAPAVAGPSTSRTVSVVRAVEKRKRGRPKKKKKRKDDWIVDSDEEDDKERDRMDEDPILSDDEFGYVLPASVDPSAAATASLQSPPTSTTGSSSSIHGIASYPSLSTHLTNSILLSGPSGSGKTAAVYACAAELGWDVFEVWPGVGVRSGKTLGVMVGEVGRNHLVGKGGTGRGGKAGGGGASEKEKGGVFSLLMSGGAKGKEKATPRNVVEEDEDPGSTVSAGDGKESVSVRQSLILLEEVDILFEEDSGFWEKVVSLIADSKRPVVMTCNGNLLSSPLSLLPSSRLSFRET
jgi:hypothetical protein